MICRCGIKYPEKVCYFSKSSTSLMMCGSAAGELLPPFVLYKATKIWNTWTEGGQNIVAFKVLNQVGLIHLF